MAIISINSLEVSAIIGIYEHELTSPQPLLFDLAMHTDIDSAASSDRIEDALDYASVALRIEEIAKTNQYKLLEGLIDHLAKTLLDEFDLIQKLAICVRKPQALANAESSSIAIEVQRE